MLSTALAENIFLPERQTVDKLVQGGAGTKKKKLAFGPFFKNVPVRAEDLSIKGL